MRNLNNVYLLESWGYQLQARLYPIHGCTGRARLCPDINKQRVRSDSYKICNAQCLPVCSCLSGTLLGWGTVVPVADSPDSPKDTNLSQYQHKI